MNDRDVRDLVSALCDGNESAYHTLVEANHDIVPLLIDLFAEVDHGKCRAMIVEVIWQHRLPNTVSFLVSILNNPYPEIWKQALDGLVTIGGAQSIKALKDCLDRIPPDDERFPWFTEAIDQINTKTM